MNTKLIPLLLFPLFVGCVSSAPVAPVNWTIAFGRADASAKFERFGDSVRISTVDVRAPYAGQRLAVLRKDGTIAFDNFNAFAGSPSLLIRGAAFDAVQASGMFDKVLPSGTAAKTEYTIEIVVTELALDCRTEGKRTARVEFALLLLRERDIVATAFGAGGAEAGGDYSVAFSTAFARAMNDALGKIPRK